MAKSEQRSSPWRAGVDERELITRNIDGDDLYVVLLLLHKNGSGEVLSRMTRVYDEGLRGERTGL